MGSVVLRDLKTEASVMRGRQKGFCKSQEWLQVNETARQAPKQRYH